MASSIFNASTSAVDQLGQVFDGTARYNNPQQAGMSQDQFQSLSDTFTNIQANLQTQADRTYKLNRDKLDNEYSIAKRQARTAEESLQIDREYKQAATALARDRLTEDSRQFNMSFGEGQRQFDANLGLNQAKLGYDLIGTAAQLRGPADYFQASNFSRGVAAQPGTATFLNALRDNTNLTGFGAQAGTPTPVSLGSLMGKLTGQGGNDGADAYQASIGGIGARGAHRLGAGALENLTDTERQLFYSGLDASGYDTPTFLDQYKRSRIGNTGSARVA